MPEKKPLKIQLLFVRMQKSNSMSSPEFKHSHQLSIFNKSSPSFIEQKNKTIV